MGIYDRDYARPPRDPRRGPLSAFPRFSVVTWLIIVCVGVFFADVLFAASNIFVPVHVGDRISTQVDPRTDRMIVPSPPAQRPAGAFEVSANILLASNNQVVGVRTWRYLPPLNAFGHFSTAKAFFGLEVWRFITFQFLHADATHLLFNMIGLWFFGPLVEQHLRTRQRTLAYYLVCGMCGALLYLTLNLLGTVFGLKLPGLLFSEIDTPLIGASAGVFGVLMAAAKIAGDSEMLLFFILPIKVRTGAYLLTLAALANLLLAGQNAGGDAAHVGGAIAGYFFIRNMHLLRDFFDILGPPSKPGSPRAGRMAQRQAKRQASRASASDAEVDAVLDKVKQHGLASLSDHEKDILRRATNDRRGA
jgi:membrane associated rhomboid family serine protease